MTRITIFRNKEGEVVMQKERLQKQPSGNAQQRQKQIRHGWIPAWVKDGQPTEVDELELFNRGINVLPNLGMLEIPPEIEQARIIALCTRTTDNFYPTGR